MRLLNVWLECAEQPIGTLLANDEGALSFHYADSWIETRANHPLSLSLPFEEVEFGDVRARAFFDNLLQENDQLNGVMARNGISRADIAGLLAHVGADCAGAVSVLPEDAPPIKRPGDLNADYDALADKEFRDLVHRLATGKPLPDGMRDPSPVAGFRDKISLAALPDGSFGLPKTGSGAPTTHIIKIPHADHRHEARDEAFVTLLAHDCALPVGTCVAQMIDEHEVLLIQRFDRIVEGNKVYRIHQEDFAQAAGLPAELKYERRGAEGRKFDAPTIGRILDATGHPALSRAFFLRMTLFNLLIGNNDNHAKNHAILHRPGEAPELAPFYDLVPVQTVPGFVEELAFNIGAAALPEDITVDDLDQFAHAIGFPARNSRTIIGKSAGALIKAIEPLALKIPVEMRALDNQIGAAAEFLNELLSLGLDVRERDAPVTSGGGWLVS
jgi:serine/threonine-protein kinase HipA